MRLLEKHFPGGSSPGFDNLGRVAESVAFLLVGNDMKISTIQAYGRFFGDDFLYFITQYS